MAAIARNTLLKTSVYLQAEFDAETHLAEGLTFAQ